MAAEMIGGDQIRAILPHKDPYVLVDEIGVRFGDEREVLGATGEWQSYPAEEAEEGTFWSDIYPFPGPYKFDKSSQLLVARHDWSGFDGHFGIVPGLETVRQMAIESIPDDAEDEQVAISGIIAARFNTTVEPNEGLSFSGVFGDKSAVWGTASNPNGEKSALFIEGLKTRKSETVNRISEAHIMEFGAQTGAVVALESPQLKGKGKIPALMHVEGVEFIDEAVLGDHLTAEVTMKEMRRATGEARVIFNRVIDGKLEKIGSVETIKFFAVSRGKLGI